MTMPDVQWLSSDFDVFNDDFPKGWVVYMDPNEEGIDLYKNGNLIASAFVTEYMESLGLSREDYEEDKGLYIDEFIEKSMKEDE